MIAYYALVLLVVWLALRMRPNDKTWPPKETDDKMDPPTGNRGTR
jgi:hypothetical protein